MEWDSWTGLYAGHLTPQHNANIFVAVLVRLVIAGLIILAARVVNGLLRTLVSRGVHAMAQRGGETSRRLTTLRGLLVSTLSYLVYFVALLCILAAFGVSWKVLAPLLGAASVLGLAIGFGAQKLVRDVITGLFILGEGQFDVGDWVTIGAVTGRVEEMGLRITRLRDDQGRLYVIANGDITQVLNASRGRIKVEVDIPLRMTPDYADTLEMLRRDAEATLADQALPDKDTPCVTIGILTMDAAKIVARVTLWVPISEKAALEDALRRRLLLRCATNECALA